MSGLRTWAFPKQSSVDVDDYQFLSLELRLFVRAEPVARVILGAICGCDPILLTVGGLADSQYPAPQVHCPAGILCFIQRFWQRKSAFVTATLLHVLAHMGELVSAGYIARRINVRRIITRNLSPGLH